jgi:hypothetical protein
MTNVDWTQVLLAVIAMVSSIVTGFLTRSTYRSMMRAREHAINAQQSADIAVEASMRPQGSNPDINLGYEGDEPVTPREGHEFFKDPFPRKKR